MIGILNYWAIIGATRGKRAAPNTIIEISIIEQIPGIKLQKQNSKHPLFKIHRCTNIDRCPPKGSNAFQDGNSSHSRLERSKELWISVSLMSNWVTVDEQCNDETHTQYTM